MVDTLEQVLYPLHMINFIVGSGFLGDRLDQPKRRLTFVYMLTVWTIYIGSFYFVVIFFMLDHTYFYLGLFMVIVNLFVTILNIIIIVRKHKKLAICVRRLSLVDDTLEELGTPKEYRKMHNSIKCLLVIWFILICITITTDSVWFIQYYNNDTKAAIIPFVLNYSLYINTLIDIKVAFLLRYIGTRLGTINDYIEKLSKSENCGLRCAWKRSIINTRRYVGSMENHKRGLWTTMHVHSELCQIARDLNSLYGIQMTLQMMSYFVVLIGMIYFQYSVFLCIERTHGDHNDQLIFFISGNIWFSIFLTKLISINHICESVSAKAHETRSVIHKLTNLIRFAETRKEICQFVLQISLRPLKLNGMGLFYFGYAFLFKFFIWFLTVVIIILQTNTSFVISQTASFSAKDHMVCYIVNQ